MYNSIARYNIVYNELTGIIVSQSHNNLIYNNTISNSGDGINVGYGSTRNKISNNSIMNSIADALLVNRGSSENTFSSNKLVSATPQGMKIVQDATSKNNIFSNNQLVHLAASTNNTGKVKSIHNLAKK